jgi:hypothetical protein
MRTAERTRAAAPTPRRRLAPMARERSVAGHAVRALDILGQ